MPWINWISCLISPLLIVESCLLAASLNERMSCFYLFLLILSVLSLGFKVKYNLICTCTPVRRKGQRKRNECQYYNMLWMYAFCCNTQFVIHILSICCLHSVDELEAFMGICYLDQLSIIVLQNAYIIISYNCYPKGTVFRLYVLINDLILWSC